MRTYEHPVHYQEIHEVAGAIALGEISPVELTQLVLERIQSIDPLLKSFSTVLGERAIIDAARAQTEILEGEERSPLHGIPIAVKDLFDVVGEVTSCGSPILRDNTSRQDATVVKRLRNAGAIVIGKLNMSEAAVAEHNPNLPTPLNPWGQGLWVGASSSGNASATAAGLCFGSLATDTGGSIRFPSACSGLTGLKTTWGRVDRRGVMPLAETLDCVGPMARSARDCALVFDAIAGVDSRDAIKPTGRDARYLARELPGFRIGIDPKFSSGFASSILEALGDTTEILNGLFANLEEVVLPSTGDLVDCWWPQVAFEALQSLGDTFPTNRQDEFGDEIRELLEFGRTIGSDELGEISSIRWRFENQLSEVFNTVDAVLIPVFGLAAPSIETMGNFPMTSRPWRDMIMPATAPFNFSGNPTVTFPAGETESGVPIGMQLVGKKYSERSLLTVIHQFQQVTKFHKSHPNLVPSN